ncbi:hypothetical protein ABIE67_000097 [Streptomyces sp. V4I8]
MKSPITVAGVNQGNTWAYEAYCWKCDWKVSPPNSEADPSCWNQAREAAVRHWWARHGSERKTVRWDV